MTKSAGSASGGKTPIEQDQTDGGNASIDAPRLTPQGRASHQERQGPDAVLLFYEEPVTVGVRRRLAYVHASSPGILELVMPDEDLDDAFIGPGDPDGQAFALINWGEDPAHNQGGGGGI